jgi:hypothetical protein
MNIRNGFSQGFDHFAGYKLKADIADSATLHSKLSQSKDGTIS